MYQYKRINDFIECLFEEDLKNFVAKGNCRDDIFCGLRNMQLFA